jgi:acyl transferase domain-containing protein
MLHALGALFARGVPFDLEALHTDRPHRKLALPTYPFERERHWLDFPERDRGGRRPSTLAPGAERLTERPTSHPFAGRLRTSRPAAAGTSAPSTSSSGSGFVRRTEDENPAKEKS